MSLRSYLTFPKSLSLPHCLISVLAQSDTSDVRDQDVAIETASMAVLVNLTGLKIVISDTNKVSTEIAGSWGGVSRIPHTSHLDISLVTNRLKTPDTRHQTLDTRHLTPDIRHFVRL